MATLTEAAYYSRKIIRYGIIGLIGFIILRLCFFVLVDAVRNAFPPKLKPNNAFGKLTSIKFPKTASPSAELKFTLQTISGSLPSASDAARVYFMPKNRVNLLSLSKAQKFAERLGFTASPTQIQNTLYRWIDLKNPLRTLEMDIVSFHFTLDYSFAHDLSLFSQRQIPSPDQAAKETLEILQTLNLKTDDLNLQPKITYLKLVGDTLSPTTSQSQADAVKIDFFRKNLDGMKIFGDDATSGVITFILSGSFKNDQRILTMKYQYWPINYETMAVYKLKTSQQAFVELTSGKGFFVTLPQNVSQIPITNVYLAYYDGVLPEYFLQPVYVFEGENKFLGYVPAVAPPWIE